ncbi:uncharacterized protein N7482_007554 [Penicillium canariense]|uniref:Uncharacterized protein n=1 Tax=Penicillium canariense TaxID=189055 RepID=A0A9W9LJY9_9EURO|nr:uncharacterized protein N7482_007554 [Penicillium canariense]KAJ5160550.1 hypothetical protein N7482_007554 [Penicillium canariense]
MDSSIGPGKVDTGRDVESSQPQAQQGPNRPTQDGEWWGVRYPDAPPTMFGGCTITSNGTRDRRLRAVRKSWTDDGPPCLTFTAVTIRPEAQVEAGAHCLTRVGLHGSNGRDWEGRGHATTLARQMPCWEGEARAPP